MSLKPKIKAVIFAGAGPGDPDLITLKTVRHLENADVVITDRLVSDLILERHVSKRALVLHAGKQRHAEGSTPQQIINELLVEYALQGKKVVRLKGGDVSVFSNLLDELQALNRYDIPYEIVPGITAACGAAAYAGIPLTARDHSQAVRFLTLHKPGLIEEKYWQELALTEDTLVFYMSGDTLPLLAQALIRSGIAADRHIALVEQATTPQQFVVSCPVHEFASRFEGYQYVSPTLVIVGKVASLHDTLKWRSNEPDRNLYFKALDKTKQQVERA